MKRKIIVLMTVLFLLTIGANLSARGAADANGADIEKLETQFELWLNRMENGEISSEEVMAQVREYQRSRSRVNEEELKEYQYCVNQLEEGNMTREQIREHIREMVQLEEEEKLMTREQTGKVNPPAESPSGKENKQNGGNGQSGKN